MSDFNDTDFKQSVPPVASIHVRDILNRYPESADTFQDHAIRYILLHLAQEAENSRAMQEMMREFISRSRDERKRGDIMDVRVSKIEDHIGPIVSRIDKLEDPRVAGVERQLKELTDRHNELEQTQETLKIKFYIGSGIVTGALALWFILANTNIAIKSSNDVATPAPVVSVMKDVKKTNP